MADEPKVPEPEVAEPEVDNPKIVIKEDLDDEPKVDEPKVAEPKVAEPKVAEPKIVIKEDLDDEKESYKYNLKNFYREEKEPVKCGSQCSKLRGFYKAKAKAKDVRGDIYGYDTDGNLVEKAKGTVVKTIALPIYRPPTTEEIDIMEKERQEAIALANRVVDEARAALYAMSHNPERDDSTMVRLNRMVMEADCKLCVARFPLMYINKEEGIKIKQLDFTQPTEKRALPYAVSIIETRPFPLQAQYVRIGEPAPAPFVSVEEAKNIIKEAAGVPIIVFEGADSNEYGYLSMEWAVVLEYNSTTYQSVYQAIYSELAKLFDDQEHLPQLLAAKTADEISYSVEDVPGDLEQNKEKWNEQLRKLIYQVNLAKFRRYPELAAKLLETKNAMIGAYEPGDEIIGIGISLENVDSKDPAKWGENVLGKALMNIRDVLRAEQSEPPVKEPPVKEPSVRKKKPTVSSSTDASKKTIPASVSAPASASVSATASATASASASTIPASAMKRASATASMKRASKAASVIPVATIAEPVAAPAAEPVAATAAVSEPASVAAPVAAPVAASVAAPAASVERRKPRVALKVTPPT
jgi:ribA/ribD-fused uncharacterized protein